MPDSDVIIVCLNGESEQAREQIALAEKQNIPVVVLCPRNGKAFPRAPSSKAIAAEIRFEERGQLTGILPAVLEIVRSTGTGPKEFGVEG